MCIRSLVLALALVACAKPGQIRKDVRDGWQLSGIMLPVGSFNVVRMDIGQIPDTHDVTISLLLKEADKQLDCNTITFVAAQPASLTKVRNLPVGRDQAVSGQMPLASLAAAAKPGLKLDWCHVVVSFNDEQIAQLKEFAEKAGT